MCDAASQDDDFRVEDVDQACQMEADKICDLSDDPASQAVACLGCTSDLLGGENRVVRYLLLKARGFPGADPIPGALGKGGTGGQCFEMPGMTTAAHPAGRIHRHVAGLGGESNPTRDHPTPADHAASDACAYRQIQHVLRALAGAVFPLRERGQVGVVLDEDGTMEGLGDACAQGKVHPTWKIRSLQDDPSVGVNRSGGSDPDAEPRG